ncbi:carbamoyltransferase HypF [bacterium]|nr:carbamoyltransferase HypF [bacterium]
MTLTRTRSPVERVRVHISGAVQGVGFRPFIYRIAHELRLAGWVGNSSEGIVIELEGPRAAIESMCDRIHRERPSPAEIHSIQFEPAIATGERGFHIAPSLGGKPTALVQPDLATCPDCAREILDPANRRYRYPFTCCTACGPRFSIVAALPYDRANTTMARFEMCPACRAEYKDPADRRFHAQANACPACGPHIELWDAAGNVIASHEGALRLAARAIGEGRIVALKGLGGFQLLCDARNGDTLASLRHRKRREARPFAVMMPAIGDAARACLVSPEEARLLASPEAPIVLMRRAEGGFIHEAVAPGVPDVGVMLPTTPLHHLLMAELGFPIVATSGNQKDEPICTDERAALTRLAGMADLFLVHNRPILNPVDDSVARVVDGHVQLLRRARGFAPLPVGPLLNPPARRAVLAVGAQQKNTVALAAGEYIFISQHLGDLQSAETLDAFNHAIHHLENLFDAKHESLARDLHPDYLSSVHCLNSTAPVLGVQHHHAHVLAAMAEHDLAGPVLGVAWDGSGLGTDGTIWGGEFLRVDRRGFERLAWLRPFALIGGEAAVREPRRAALGLILELTNPERFEPDLLELFSARELSIFKKMAAGKLNSPFTSSAGRLFDGVAALAGLPPRVSYEGQAALALEAAVLGVNAPAYPFECVDAAIDWRPMIESVLDDRRAGATVAAISARFHATMIEMVIDVARRAGLDDVVLCGGCFQNRVLLEGAISRLRHEQFRPWWPRLVPPNDGGIALGQAAAALWSER